MELGSIWLGGFRFGLLDCPPGNPAPIELTKPTPVLFKRAVKRTRRQASALAQDSPLDELAFGRRVQRCGCVLFRNKTC